MRLLLASLFIFLASVLIGRRAQSNEVASHTLSFAQPFVDLLRTQDQGLETLRNTMEEGNIQGVVSLLQNHIKQWSFIEAQLLEPNVNLGMPEIFIPLKHLTTTLQTLGSIFLMKNDLQEAKVCLERACPLMELLPTTVDDSYKLDAFAFANAYFEADLDSTGQPKSPIEGNEDIQGNYAANCFALLRSVYMRIYDKQQQQQQLQQLETPKAAAPSVQRKKPSSIKPVKMATLKARGPPVRSLAEDDYYDDDYDDYVALYEKIQGAGEEGGGKVVKQAESERCEPEVDKQEDNTAAIDDLIEQLRQPFQHLRSEILMVRNQDATSSAANKQRKEEKKSMKERYLQETEGRLDDESFSDTAAASSSQMSKAKKSMRERWEQSTKIQFSSNLLKDEDVVLPAYLEREDMERELGLRRAQTMASAGADDMDPFGLGSTGSSTSIVASDLEIMLRKFVKEDAQGRKKLLKQASHYYSELDVNFPFMDYNEYAANMDLGVVYLEVMERVVKEGFDFIAPELERWQDVGQALILKSAKLTRLDEKDDRELLDEASLGLLGIIWELDPESGKKKEYSVELDGNYFDAFSLHERNRLLVLSAFDIAAHLEPAEQFDLSLGFSLGILDNDRSRQREQDQLELESPDGVLSKNRKKKPKQPHGKLDKVVSAALFEEQTSPAIGISSSFRSSVPTLSLENDWSFHIFLFFLFLTFAIVVASHLSASKKKTRIRTRPAKRTSPYEQLFHALFRPVASLFSMSDPNDENDETVVEALSNIVKSWQILATAEWILGGVRKTVLVDFPHFLWTKGLAMLAGDGKGSKKLAEKDKTKTSSKDAVSSTTASTSTSSAPSPVEELELAKKAAEQAPLQTTAPDARKTKALKPPDSVEEKDKNVKGKTVNFADKVEDDNSHGTSKNPHSSIPPKSALAKPFRSALAADDTAVAQEERAVEPKVEKALLETSSKQQKKVESTSSRKSNNPSPSSVPVTNPTPVASSAAIAGEDLVWYDWQEMSQPKAEEGWTEAKRKTPHKQKESKKGGQPTNVAIPTLQKAAAPVPQSAGSSTNSNQNVNLQQKSSVPAKKALVKAPIGGEGARRSIGLEELLAKQAIALNLEDHLAKSAQGKTLPGANLKNEGAPSSPSFDSMHPPGLFPSDATAKGVSYKNVVANEVSPSLLPPAADQDSMSTWMSQTLLGNNLFGSAAGDGNILTSSAAHESATDDTSSLFYRLGLAGYGDNTVQSGASTISTLSAPPGLEKNVHQMPSYSNAATTGIGSHFNTNLSFRSQRDMEQDMEQDMESQNLLQGILGDILHPSSPGLEQSSQHLSALNSSSGLFGSSAYSHSSTMSFLYSNISNLSRDAEQSNLSAQSDLSPLAPVFDPTKGLVLQEEDAVDTSSSLWDWKHE